jgi:hypothetical protein
LFSGVASADAAVVVAAGLADGGAGGGALAAISVKAIIFSSNSEAGACGATVTSCLMGEKPSIST